MNVENFLKLIIEKRETRTKDVDSDYLYFNRIKVFMNRLGITFDQSLRKNEIDLNVSLDLLR